MKFLLGKKQYMTQVFDDAGRLSVVTVVEAGPVRVTQVKSREKDGYSALQVGYGPTKASRVAKPQRSHAGEWGPFSYLKECRLAEESGLELKAGDSIDASSFSAGDKVRISGHSKGKGFQGGVKRHGFAGGPRTHGQKHSEREPGSIGGMGIQRVLKGTKMAGRMGYDRVTLKDRPIISVDAERNLLYIKGAIPGRRGTILEITG